MQLSLILGSLGVHYKERFLNFVLNPQKHNKLSSIYTKNGKGDSLLFSYFLLYMYYKNTYEKTYK